MSEPALLDRFAAARAVADAVLYEGYVLYPYRASSRKNQLRWQFGVLTPRAFSEADGSERWSMRTECVVAAKAETSVSVRIRCLQIQHRAVEAPATGGGYTPVDTLVIDGNVHVDWDEALDRVVDLPSLSLSSLADTAYQEVFGFEGGDDTEEITDTAGEVAGRITRRREPLEGCVRVEASGPVEGGPFVKVTVTVENRTVTVEQAVRRDEVMARSLVAVHTMLAVDDATFVSLLDPPDQAREVVASCHNDGSFPVLIGRDDVVLSSPIILYDHPTVAPESPGDLYDSTEIDEILALRVLTLTDEEKAEARGTDPRAAAVIDRCDSMPPELWERLHGAVRALRSPGGADLLDAPPAEAGPEPIESGPWWDPSVDASVDPWTDTLAIGDVIVKKGSAVRLHPSLRSDAQDFFLDGLTATVAGVFKDVDGSEHVAVTLDDDPASAEFEWQGRYLFFHPIEVEPL